MPEQTELEQFEAALNNPEYGTKFNEPWDEFTWSYQHDALPGWEHCGDVEQDTSRWHTFMWTIWRSPSNELYAFEWRRGLTEYQENYADTPVRPFRVEGRPITTIEYVRSAA